MFASPLFLMFMVVFIDLVGFGIVIPILPYYATSFGASALELGWLMASYSLMQFLVAPLWGRLSDRIGRRPVILISLAGTGLALTLLGFASRMENPIFWLFIGRIFAGICAANISVAYAYVADVTTDANRAKGMGLIGAGFGLGFIFGPAMGGVLSRYGYDAPMFAAAILTALNFVLAVFKLKEPPIDEATRALNRSKRFDLATIRGALTHPQSGRAIGLFFLATFAITQMEVVFALYMKARFDYDAQSAGLMLAFLGLIMVLIQGGAIGKLVTRFGELRLVSAGSLIAAVGLIIFAMTGSQGWILVSLALMAFGRSVLHPSLSTLTSVSAPPGLRGGIMGVFHSSASLARVIGPICAGLIYDRVGITSPFWLGAGVFALTFIVGLRWEKSLKVRP